jgi:hypothetical protein
MADLSVASTYMEFENNFKTQRDAMSVVNDQLEQAHRSVHRQNTASYYSRSYETPDKESFDMASSVAISALLVVLNAIREAEDMVEMLSDEGDELDPEELCQAQGELSGAKNTYISMVKMFGKVETVRLQSSASSMPSHAFMKCIVDNMGLPDFGSYIKDFPEFVYTLNADKYATTKYKIKYASIPRPF